MLRHALISSLVLTLSLPAIAQGPLLVSDAAASAAEQVARGSAAEPEPAAPELAVAPGMRDGRITRGFARHRVLLFTFDDGPRLDTTPRLLDMLDAHGVRATFFLVGRQLEGRRRRRQRALVREMAARGHTIGAHSFSHRNLTQLDDSALFAQIRRTEKAFEATLGVRPFLFRPPYGAHDERVDELLAAREYTPMLWNVTAADTSSRTQRDVVEAFRASFARRERHPRGPGGIVLLHDTHDWVVDAVPEMIEIVRTRNCELLEDEGEELWDVSPDPRIFHQPRRGAPATRRARTVRLAPAEIATRQAELRREAQAWCAARVEGPTEAPPVTD